MVTSSLSAPYRYYLLDAQLSQEIDHRTINEMNIDGFTLMEVAGSSAAQSMWQHNPGLTHGLVFCGKGNNAGDALVTMRYLIQNGISATIVFLSGTENLSENANKNLRLLQKFDSNQNLSIIKSWDNFDSEYPFDFIIDGMLGIGLNSDVRGDYAKAVKWINEQQQSVFSMDVPTGLHADSGQTMGCAIKADQTFAFGGLKQGFYLNNGPSVTGEITNCELPFPNQYKEESSTFLLDENWIPIKTPTPGKHKYDSGVLYIIAGSEGLTGAAMLAARSAWAEGLGAVILICPRGILSIYEQTLPTIIKKPVGKRDDFFFKKEFVQEVLSIVQDKDGHVLLGPGLGRADLTVPFVDQFLSKNTSDTVIDADGLWCLSQIENWQKPEPCNWILTPHPGELQQITGKQIKNDHQRLSIVRRLAQRKKVTVLSKGMPAMIGTPTGKCYLTNYQTRYFARAGSGDVLAGKTGAFWAFHQSPDQACAMGLLRGKQKLDHLLANGITAPEPTDFI